MKGLFTGVGGKATLYENGKQSCLREVEEETGIRLKKVTLKGVVKTILDGHNSAWILYIYYGVTPHKKVISCPEGELRWVNKTKVNSLPLIGFIREILEILNNSTKKIIDATITHDLEGNVLKFFCDEVC